MFFLFFCLILVVPLIELSILVELAGRVGILPTIGLSLFTAALGSWLAKRELLRVWRGWKQALAAGKVPEDGVIDGFLIAFAALLLLVPGVFTDLVGFSLLIPWIRKRLVRPTRGAISHRVVVVQERSQGPHGGYQSPGFSRGSARSLPEIIDAEYESVEESPRDQKK